MRRLFQTGICILFIFLRLHPVMAENPDSLRRYQRLDASYIFGGQVYNNNLIYNPGFSLQVSYGLILNESVNVGLGTGYMQLTDEHFIPLYIEVTGNKKNKANTPFIHMQLGYAPGWYTGDREVQGYKFRGGIYFDAGIGRKIEINDKYTLLFHWSYRHQFAHMEYEVFGKQHYSEAMNYDMILISVGILKN